MGVTNRFMMTPNDTQLRQWVKDQAFSSITPKDLFNQSLLLSMERVYGSTID